jgi:hypothetical protein
MAYPARVLLLGYGFETGLADLAYAAAYVVPFVAASLVIVVFAAIMRLGTFAAFRFLIPRARHFFSDTAMPRREEFALLFGGAVFTVLGIISVSWTVYDQEDLRIDLHLLQMRPESHGFLAANDVWPRGAVDVSARLARQTHDFKIEWKENASHTTTPVGLVIGGRTVGWASCDTNRFRFPHAPVTHAFLDLGQRIDTHLTSDVYYVTANEPHHWCEPGDPAVLVQLARPQHDVIVRGWQQRWEDALAQSASLDDSVANDRSPTIGYRVVSYISSPRERAVHTMILRGVHRLDVEVRIIFHRSDWITPENAWSDFLDRSVLLVTLPGGEEMRVADIDLALRLPGDVLKTSTLDGWAGFGRGIRYRGPSDIRAGVVYETAGWNWLPYLLFPAAIGLLGGCVSRYRRWHIGL